MSGNEYDDKPGGRIRVGDQEREDAVKRLGAHYEAGRLSAEEHTERVGQALQAKTAAELNELFVDLPGESPAPGYGAQHAGAEGPGGQGGEGQGWAGPWGWMRPPWTSPENEGAWQGGPGKSGAKRGPFGRVPVPVLVVLAVLGVLLSVGCTIVGGHPPLLPLLLIGAGTFIFLKRRQEGRA